MGGRGGRAPRDQGGVGGAAPGPPPLPISSIETLSFHPIYGMFPILRERARQQAETLSGGEQQMLALGRAMLRRPRLLMLDEPSLGLAPRVARNVYEALGMIARTGTTILLVEQNARLALGVARRVAILEFVRVLA